MRFLLCILYAFALSIGTLWGQTPQNELTCTVVDRAGKVLLVTDLEESNNALFFKLVTSEDGGYVRMLKGEVYCIRYADGKEVILNELYDTPLTDGATDVAAESIASEEQASVTVAEELQEVSAEVADGSNEETTVVQETMVIAAQEEAASVVTKEEVAKAIATYVETYATAIKRSTDVTENELITSGTISNADAVRNINCSGAEVNVDAANKPARAFLCQFYVAEGSELVNDAIEVRYSFCNARRESLRKEWKYVKIGEKELFASFNQCVVVTLYNRSNRTLYVDLGKCFLIRAADKDEQPYYTHQFISSIAPHCELVLDGQFLFPVGCHTAYKGIDSCFEFYTEALMCRSNFESRTALNWGIKRGESKEWSREESPIEWSTQICYSFSEHFLDERNITATFYLRRAVGDKYNAHFDSEQVTSVPKGALMIIMRDK